MISPKQMETLIQDPNNRVRVWDGPHASIRAEGTLIGYCPVPTLIIRKDDGTLVHEASSLPVEVMTWTLPERDTP